MADSPSNSTTGFHLYRNARCAVICAVIMFLFVNAGFAQSSSKAKKLTGPRALGLLEITPSGGVTLLPVTIMIDGEFYDASAYKAAPVPLALYTDTVYEGVQTGVSQGLFTVTTAQQGENVWRGLGRWQSAADISAAAARRKAAEAKAAIPKVDTDGPPVLKRPGVNEPAKSPAASTPATTSESNPDDPYSPPVLKKPATPAASTPTPADSTPTNPAPPMVTQAGTPATAVPAPAAQTPPPAVTTPAASDPNLPTLRRGKAAAAKEEARETTSTPAAPVKLSKASPGKPVSVPAPAAKDGIQFVPAISDAAGPEPRPYAYSMKPDEEAKFRNKMLALAGIELRARAKARGQATAAPTTAGAHPTRTAKPPEPTFEDVQLRVFDLSNNNEPILVLTANARLPHAAKGTVAADLQYELTVVAREDIYGDLHKAFSNVTDTQHLDVLPRVDFIDAVDADGDGRGELLFRQVSDAGRAFSLYRVIGDQLWPLFQGKLGR